MAKKKTAAGKIAAKNTKKAKTAEKKQKKEKKKQNRDSDDGTDNEDLEGILEKMRLEWEEKHKVTDELVEGPPSRRANATLTACPSGNYLWCIGGEYFSEDNKAHFYNDVYRYSPEKDEWRKFISQTCPGPRSAHAAASSPTGGGKLFLFGGEFSSLHQNSFHHYRDFWCFDISTHTWDRIDTKILPSSRSGHRMACWKSFIILFGGFYDPGTTTRYLNDLWVFDMQEYMWHQIEFRESESRPSSGFSFLSTPEGIVLHGGYCKEYSKGKRPVGVMLNDTWFLRLSLQSVEETESINKNKKKNLPLLLKWERRKRPSTAYAPSQRSGCTMTSWPTKSMGIMFGGVTDEDNSEETLESTFWNDLNGYQWIGNGRWMSLNLRRPKNQPKTNKRLTVNAEETSDKTSIEGVLRDLDDPSQTVPLPRYNAMLAVLKNTLFIYGGIYERGSKEYTLDDFYSLNLEKLDRFVCLKRNDLVFDDGDDDSTSDDSDDGPTSDEDTEGDTSSSEYTPDEELNRSGDRTEINRMATLIDSADTRDSASVAQILTTPLPGETLAIFYARSREVWTQRAASSGDDAGRGKELRRNGFALASERYEEYLPTLREQEKILAEAGLDAEEIKKGAAVGGGRQGENRNRR